MPDVGLNDACSMLLNWVGFTASSTLSGDMDLKEERAFVSTIASVDQEMLRLESIGAGGV